MFICSENAAGYPETATLARAHCDCSSVTHQYRFHDEPQNVRLRRNDIEGQAAGGLPKHFIFVTWGWGLKRIKVPVWGKVRPLSSPTNSHP